LVHEQTQLEERKTIDSKFFTRANQHIVQELSILSEPNILSYCSPPKEDKPRNHDPPKNHYGVQQVLLGSPKSAEE
jgi:hypothetical protein